MKRDGLVAAAGKKDQNPDPGTAVVVVTAKEAVTEEAVTASTSVAIITAAG